MLQVGADGFVNLNKPLGWTSHDCVARLRRLLKTRKVGHAGTLDPAADGVLPIAVGRATRLLQFLPTGKAYRAIVRFGITTDSDDLDGKILTQQACAHLTEAQVLAQFPAFLGKIEQVPPAFSAIQVDGKRLYELARAGQAVEVPKRSVEVFSLEALAWRSGEFPELELAVQCGGGTYIRSIARDLGAAVGTGATLAGLTRTHSSGFDQAQSLTLEDLEARLEESQTHPHRSILQPVESPFLHYPEVKLTSEEAWRWGNGQKILPITIAEKFPGPIAATDRLFRVSYQAPALPIEHVEDRVNPEQSSSEDSKTDQTRQFLGIGELQEVGESPENSEPYFLKARMVYAHAGSRPEGEKFELRIEN